MTDQNSSASAAAFSAAYDPNKLENRLTRSTKGDGYASTMKNAFLVISEDEEFAGCVAFDEFSQKIVKLKPPPIQNGEAGDWCDKDDLRTVIFLDDQYGINIKQELVAQAVELAADLARFHPVRDYLDSLRWDGKPRIDYWLRAYLGARCVDLQGDDAERYLRTAGSKFLIAAVARINAPGCKADHVLILEGPQGAGKSTAFKVLFSAQWFTDTPIGLGDKDAYQALPGKWCVEQAELESFNRADTEQAKAFFSSAVDHYRPSYGRRMVSIRRQCVFAGTANKDAYFKDESGNRRYWPVRCTHIELFGPDSLESARDQLWAEAVVRYRAGEIWWPDKDEVALFEAEQDARYLGDAYEDVITAYAVMNSAEELTMSEILGDALKLDKSKWSRAEQTRVGLCMKRLGWIRARPGKTRVFRKPKVGGLE